LDILLFGNGNLPPRFVELEVQSLIEQEGVLFVRGGVVIFPWSNLSLEMLEEFAGTYYLDDRS
jgi:hypothetical protein